MEENRVNASHTFRKGFQLGQGNLLKASVLRKMALPPLLTASGLKSQKIIGTKMVVFSRGHDDEPLFFHMDAKEGQLFGWHMSA